MATFPLFLPTLEEGDGDFFWEAIVGPQVNFSDYLAPLTTQARSEAIHECNPKGKGESQRWLASFEARMEK
jgi:hypothetical protein